MAYKMGKLPPKVDPTALRLLKYLTPNLPTPPDKLDWSKGLTDWHMMMNDQAGCCTVTALGHHNTGWTVNTKPNPEYINDDEIIRVYSAVSGYNPRIPASDRGAAMVDVLNYVRVNGIGGHRGWGFVQINPKDKLQVRFGLWAFGGLYFGANLPSIAVDQFDSKKPWTVPSYGPIGNAAPGSGGGHAMYMFADNRCIPWRYETTFTDEWWYTYVDECYAILSVDWIDRITRISPSGFDFDTLVNDQAILAGVTPPRPTPPPNPTPNPIPTPTPSPTVFMQSPTFIGADNGKYRIDVIKLS